MDLDYQIINLLHPHYVKGHGCVYDHIKWIIWISNQSLLDDINEEFDCDFEPNKDNEVKEEAVNAIWQYIREQKKWIGVYGTEYDSDILNIYNDLDDDANRNW